MGRYGLADFEYEGMYSGHPACQGCGVALGLRFVAKVLHGRAFLIVVASCSTTIAGVYPTASMKTPTLHTAFATGGAAASGLSAALEVRGQADIPVVVWAGDGGTFDIGLQSLSGAAERNDSFLFLCCDNEAYMNTGIQRSGSTPYGAITTTTPESNPERRFKKDIMGIMAAHGIPYAATTTIGYPEDMIRKVQRALCVKGPRFIHILTPCPSGWRYSSDLTAKISRLAVETKIFPLYEIIDGVDYRLTYRPSKSKDVSEYLSLQARYNALTDDDIETIRCDVERRWQLLMSKCSRKKSNPGLRKVDLEKANIPVVS
jgi:pyruvate/2-oxoacid:ferredoxin oxidoreductase beta subunit